MSAPDPTFFATPAAFRAWLARHAATSRELIVGFWKVGSGKSSMTWSEAVDEALCVGWIDGVTKRIDGRAYQIRFTPRKPTSIWSAVNIRKVHALEAEGRMTDAGRAAFARRTAETSAIYSHERTTPPDGGGDTHVRGERPGVAVLRGLSARVPPADPPLDHDGEEAGDAGPAAREDHRGVHRRHAPAVRTWP